MGGCSKMKFSYGKWGKSLTLKVQAGGAEGSSKNVGLTQRSWKHRNHDWLELSLRHVRYPLCFHLLPKQILSTDSARSSTNLQLSERQLKFYELLGEGGLYSSNLVASEFHKMSWEESGGLVTSFTHLLFTGLLMCRKPKAKQTQEDMSLLYFRSKFILIPCTSHAHPQGPLQTINRPLKGITIQQENTT